MVYLIMVVESSRDPEDDAAGTTDSETKLQVPQVRLVRDPSDERRQMSERLTLILSFLSAALVTACLLWRTSLTVRDTTIGLPSAQWCTSLMALYTSQMVLSVCLFRLWQDYRDATRIERATGMLCAVWGALQITVVAATMTAKIPEGWTEWWVRLLLVGSAPEACWESNAFGDHGLECALDGVPSLSRLLYDVAVGYTPSLVQSFSLTRAENVTLSSMSFADRESMRTAADMPTPQISSAPSSPAPSPKPSSLFTETRGLEVSSAPSTPEPAGDEIASSEWSTSYEEEEDIASRGADDEESRWSYALHSSDFAASYTHSSDGHSTLESLESITSRRSAPFRSLFMWIEIFPTLLFPLHSYTVQPIPAVELITTPVAYFIHHRSPGVITFFEPSYTAIK
ncbi:hypothetical protein HWV62_13827 [Athelia sp. TMB]|nr:hypothetical protein HWV62_13827 [Athelia sp. TMB]